MAKNRFRNKYHEEHSTFIPHTKDFLQNISQISSIKVFNGGKIRNGFKNSKKIVLTTQDSNNSVKLDFFNDGAKQTFYFVPESGNYQVMTEEITKYCNHYAQKYRYRFEYPLILKNLKEDAINMENPKINLSKGISFFNGLKKDWSDVIHEMLLMFRKNDTTGAINYAEALNKIMEEKDKNFVSHQQELQVLRVQIDNASCKGINEIVNFLKNVTAEWNTNYKKVKTEHAEIANFLTSKIERKKALLQEKEQFEANIANLRKKLAETAKTATSKLLKNITNQIELEESSLLRVAEQFDKIEDTTEAEHLFTKFSTDIAEMEKVKHSVSYFESIVQVLNDLITVKNKETWWQKQLQISKDIIATSPTSNTTIDVKIASALRSIDEITIARVLGKGIVSDAAIYGLEKNNKHKTISLIIKALANDLQHKTDDKLSSFLQQKIQYTGKDKMYKAVATKRKKEEIKNRILELGFVSNDGSINYERILEVYNEHTGLGHFKNNKKY